MIKPRIFYDFKLLKLSANLLQEMFSSLIVGHLNGGGGGDEGGEVQEN